MCECGIGDDSDLTQARIAAELAAAKALNEEDEQVLQVWLLYVDACGCDCER